MSTLWDILSPENQAEIRRYMGAGWVPPRLRHQSVKLDAKLEPLDEVARIMSAPPASHNDLLAED